MRIAVYTAIFGDKDEAPELLHPDADLSDEFDFICVTDNPGLISSSYRMVTASPEFPDLTKNARSVKINGFEGIEEYDVAIWHDSSVRMDCSKLTGLSRFASDHAVSAFHHRRYCAYLEAVECINHRKDSPVRIALQMFRYFRRGFPANYRLHETTIMVLNCRTYFSSELRSLWWDEVRTRSRRDQLALAYARWRTGTDVGLLEGITGTGVSNRFSVWTGHRYDHYLDSSTGRKLDTYLIRGLCKRLIYEMRRRR